jgi:hypothetical protein
VNWSRGLLRIWLVLSALWLAPMSVATVMNWPDACCDPQTHEVTDPAVLSELEKSTAGLQDKDAIDVEFLSRARRKHELAAKRRHEMVAILLASTFLPPIGLLAIGYVVLWIGRGFRKEPPQ